MRIIAIAVLVVLLNSCAVQQWQPSQYTVARGDTLYAIAWRYRLDYKQLAKWNRIAAPYTIYPGQRIWIAKPAKAVLKQQTASKEKTADTPRTKPIVKKPAVVVKETASDKKILWRWPLKKPYKLIKSFAGSNSVSQGIDLQASNGQAVYAAADGFVVYSGNGLIGYGNLLIVKHNDTYLSAYALNQKLYVQEGEKVSKGQKIAAVGLNLDKKPTLHFEIRRYGKPVNPIKYLP